MSETATTDARKATAERNVAAIVDAGERLLRSDREPTISAVAAEAGVSRPTVYAHFKDRTAIVEAIVARAVERAMAAVRSARPDEGPPADALERLIAESWEHVAGNQEIARAAAADLSADTAAPANGHGNGNGKESGSAEPKPKQQPAAAALTDTPPVVPARMSRELDLGPACEQCGGMMQRTGSCYTCTSCGNNTGCG
jgi:AcrR family transcriptional regulator